LALAAAGLALAAAFGLGLAAVVGAFFAAVAFFCFLSLISLKVKKGFCKKTD